MEDNWAKLSATWPPPKLFDLCREVMAECAYRNSLLTPEERAIIEEIWRQRREAMND